MKSIKLITLLIATSLLAGCVAPTRTVYVPVEKSETGSPTVVAYPVYVVRPAPVFWGLHMGWYGHSYHRRGPWHR